MSRESNIEYIRELIAGTPWQSDANAVEVADRFTDSFDCRKEITLTRDILNKAIDFDSPFQPRNDAHGRRRIGYGRAFRDALEQARAMAPMVETGNIAAVRAVIDKIASEKRRLGEEGLDPKQISYLEPDDLAAAIQHLGNTGVLAPSLHAQQVASTASRHASETAEHLAIIAEVTGGKSTRPILQYGRIISVSASDLGKMSLEELRKTLAETRRIRALRNETREQQQERLRREADAAAGHRRYAARDSLDFDKDDQPSGETSATFVRGAETRSATTVISRETGQPHTAATLKALARKADAAEWKSLINKYGADALNAILAGK